MICLFKRCPALLGVVAVIALLLVGTSGARAASIPLLPGEATWSGIPAFDFGANDGVNWDPGFNMDSGPDAAPIQSSLKAGHLSIVRAWFFQTSLVDNHAVTDAEQLQKLQAVLNSGAVCFANFPTGNTVAYNLHLLSLLGGKCPYVEVMNEPDIEGVDSTQYLAFWNSFVPQARAQFPGILYGGPADYDNQGNECSYYSDGTSACFLQKVLLGMKASGNLPDFVTYHWYPCWNNTAAQCLALAGSFASAAQQVINWDTQIFGTEIPVICSEWNADPGSPSYMTDRNWDAQYVAAALKNIETSGLAGAMEYDISEYGNYSADDLFDIYNNGVPFATWTNGFAPVATAAFNGQASTPPPSPTSTTPPSPSPTQPPSPTPSPTHPPSPTQTPPPTPGPSGLVQSATHISLTTAKTAVTLKAVKQGDFEVAAVAIAGGNTYSVGSLTDSQGNVWTLATSGINGDETLTAIYFTLAKAAGDDTITLQGKGSGFVQSAITAAEFTGLSQLVGGAAAESTGTSHTVSVPSATVTLGVYADAGYSKGITSTGAQLGSLSQNTDQIEFDVALASGFTTSGSAYAEVAAASFK